MIKLKIEFDIMAKNVATKYKVKLITNTRLFPNLSVSGPAMRTEMAYPNMNTVSVILSDSSLAWKTLPKWASDGKNKSTDSLGKMTSPIRMNKSWDGIFFI